MNTGDGAELFRCWTSMKDFSVVDTEYETSCYAAVHMDECNVEDILYYGRIRSIIQVQIDVCLIPDE